MPGHRGVVVRVVVVVRAFVVVIIVVMMGLGHGGQVQVLARRVGQQLRQYAGGQRDQQAVADKVWVGSRQGGSSQRRGGSTGLSQAPQKMSKMETGR